MTEGLVSTIIPVYNRPGMLREAVASVLAQTYRPIEIIIVDDGSTDETSAACTELAAAHPEVRTTRIANGGPGAAREAGRQLARGEFIQYLDSDDLVLPEKFSIQVAALRLRPDCGVSYCRTREYFVENPAGAWLSADTDAGRHDLFPYLLTRRRWQTPSPLFRRTVTDAVGAWTRLRQEEDWEYDARVGALGTRLDWRLECLAEVRHHHDSRAGGRSMERPDRMRSRYDAHCLILDHARRSGIDRTDPHMQHYARELFLLARQCGCVGLSDEAAHLFELARSASPPGRAKGLDYRLYALLARILGWSAAGRLACWSDRLRQRAT